MVQVPRVNRLQPTSALPDNPRIQGNVPDSASSILNRTNQITQVVEKGADIYQAYEDETINEGSSKIGRDLDSWLDEQYTRADELMKKGADPKEIKSLYAEIEGEFNVKQQELLDEYKDSPERVKRHLKSNTEKTSHRLRSGFSARRNKDIETVRYQDHQRNLEHDNKKMVESAGFIRGADKGSLFHFRREMNESRNTIARYMGEKLPLDAKEWDHLERDNEGNVIAKYKLSKAAKAQTTRQAAKGVADSIDVLLANKKTEEAELISKEFGDLLSSEQKIKVANKLNSGKKSDKASEDYDKIRLLPEAELREKIRNVEDGEIRRKMQNFHEHDILQREKDRKRKQDLNNELLVKDVVKNQYPSIAALEESPVYRQTWDNLSATQQQNIIKSIKPPKTSDPEAEKRYYETYNSGAIIGMEVSELMELTAGLSETKRNQAINDWKKLNTQSSSEKRIVFNQAKEDLYRKMKQFGYIRAAEFGKHTSRDNERIRIANEALHDKLRQYAEGGLLPTGLEMEKFVNDLTINLKNETLDQFNPVNPRLSRKKKNPLDNVTREQRKQFAKEYRKEFGSYANENELNEYIRSKVSQGNQ